MMGRRRWGYVSVQNEISILLIHGTDFRDRKHLCYWGRIPRVLESHGVTDICDCYVSLVRQLKEDGY